jgi:hypothetical protein
MVVVLAVVAAVVFGVYIGYLAWSNDSFPAETRTFGQYASVTSFPFNGTEFAFRLSWLNSSYVPLYAQLTSPVTDAANTPVCDLKVSNVSTGQSLFLPFTISPPSATVDNVDLSIAVKSISSGNEFTIVFNVPTASATNGDITPSNVSCQQPLGPQ